MDPSSAASLRRRLAGNALLASAPIGAVSIAALGGMFASFAGGARDAALTFGRVNDILVIAVVLLTAPAVVELFVLTGPGQRLQRIAVATIGLGAIAWIAWFQWLLVTERMTFQEQVGLVIVGFAGLATWFIATGWRASRLGLLPGGTRLGVVAALFIGQPWWAIRWGRLLRALGSAETPPDSRIAGPAGAADRYPAAAGHGPGR